MPNNYIKFKCNSCKKRVGVPDIHAGKQVKCPICGGATKVPLESEPKKGDNTALSAALEHTHIKYYCETCKKRIAIPAGLRGKTIKCPLCGNPSHVPQASQPKIKPGKAQADATKTEGEAAAKDQSEAVEETHQAAPGAPPDQEQNAAPAEAQPTAETGAERPPDEPSEQEHKQPGQAGEPADKTESAEAEKARRHATEPPKSFPKTVYTLEQLKKDSENLPKPEPPPEPEVPIKKISLNPFVAAGILAVFVLLMLAATNWRKVNYYLFYRAKSAKRVSRDIETVKKMRDVHQTVYMILQKKKHIPPSVEEIYESGFLNSPESLKNGEGKWLFVYEAPTPVEIMDYEHPKVMLYDAGPRKDKKRHIMFSNGNVIAVHESEFKKRLEQCRRAYEALKRR